MYSAFALSLRLPSVHKYIPVQEISSKSDMHTPAQNKKNRFFLNIGLKFLEAQIKNRPQLVFVKSIFTSIPKVSDKFIEKCRRSRLFGDI